MSDSYGIICVLLPFTDSGLSQWCTRCHGEIRAGVDSWVAGMAPTHPAATRSWRGGHTPSGDAVDQGILDDSGQRDRPQRVVFRCGRPQPDLARAYNHPISQPWASPEPHLIAGRSGREICVVRDLG